jgi:WbqC-like protein family
MNTVVIHQPDFLSYLGFFHRFLKADMWVILDTVQYMSGTSRSWQNRDKIKTAQGEKWITVSVQKAPIGTPIKDILLSENSWRIDNLNLIRNSYSKALYFDEVMPYVKGMYAFECRRLMEFNQKSAETLMELFDIKIKTVFASELKPAGKSNALLVDILQKVKADRYLSGTGAKGYFDPVPFADTGIEVIWQDFKHPVYPQLYGSFIPYLSSIDLLFNCGIEKSRKILRSCL